MTNIANGGPTLPDDVDPPGGPTREEVGNVTEEAGLVWIVAPIVVIIPIGICVGMIVVRRQVKSLECSGLSNVLVVRLLFF